MEKQKFDVVIVGGGHNGLTAAAYLAQAGLSVCVLERLATWGGAAISAQTFEGVEARLSSYSYLVSMLPEKIIAELKLPILLAKRRFSSYTPTPGGPTGLLVDNHDSAATKSSFDRIGAGKDFGSWNSFYSASSQLAKCLFPGSTDPLITRSEARDRVLKLKGGKTIWQDFIETEIGLTIQSHFDSDLVRGIALTDGLIGTFANTVDETFESNRCFLYHVIGGGTGDWDVPLGGMGAISQSLLNAARRAGTRLINEAEVTQISDSKDVYFTHLGKEQVLSARYVLVNASPNELSDLLSSGETAEECEGAQVKVNMVLRRLPRLIDPSTSSEAAFGGTFHVNESFSQLETAFQTAKDGLIPSPIPCEIYCHSITDPSILSPELADLGAHTLTVFGLQTPHRLSGTMSPDLLRERLQEKVVASVNSVLSEPIQDLVLEDAAGNPCIQTKTTLDLEETLKLPGGNIFHGQLQWPFAEDGANLTLPAQRWGVSTDNDGIFLCGSGAHRGGAVSGIGGHNAAMAVLESESR